MDSPTEGSRLLATPEILFQSRPRDPSYACAMSAVAIRGAAAHQRLARARRWLLERGPAEETLVVAASRDAANDLLRGAALERGASFGWHRVTLDGLAASLAESARAAAELVPVGGLVVEAVVARVVHALASAGRLGRYARVAEGPGFARAVAGVIHELRMAGLGADVVEERAPELAVLATAYEAELARAGLADRALVFALAVDAVASAPLRSAGGATVHPFLGRPTLLLDVAVVSSAERSLIEALAAGVPQLLATIPSGDAKTLEHLQRLPGLRVEACDGASDPARVSLFNLQTHLFEEAAPAESPLGEDVSVLSAPGESRECVEVVRRVLGLARAGTAFDRIAVLLRSPQEYRCHLEEAFSRAGVPAHFARGAVRPDPAGRAFIALLACAAEGLSALRFAEYLSLGEVPNATPEGAPPEAAPPDARWVAPDDALVSEAISDALANAVGGDRADEAPIAAPSVETSADSTTESAMPPVSGGSLRAPRRWEKVLVDAAVIGGLERWRRRLDGRSRELCLDLEAREDPEGAAAERIQREQADLAALHAYALPLLESLDALPGEATWGVWLDALSALATRALRRPERVLATLSELWPMAEVGPVAISEVQQVLAPRLLEVARPPPKSRYGKVFVAPADAARGLDFDAVFVPGLAERLFPRDIDEEPILLDPVREALGGGLVTREQRVARERLTFRLAVGAAREQLVLSYPRLDLDKSRPRVPSFYALEALRAAEGRLPGFDELAAKAERLTDARVGWPAPRAPEDAIDEAEHDLALIEGLLRLDPEQSAGTARYLLSANPHLGRALRFRARRWLTGWTPADGLVKPSQNAVDAIGKHALAKRSFSPTALQHFAACPYKFFLQAILRLAPREVPDAIEEIPALERGSLVHEVQYELFGKLAEAGLLPVRPDTLASARALLDAELDAVAARYHDDLAPAIPRVWEDGVAAVRADLREWLRLASVDDSGFVPAHFELAFGLPGRRDADPHSKPAPVALDCGLQVRGSIDLVERHPDGRLRATDHKTGKKRVDAGAVVAGGEALQPVLYALVLEKLFASKGLVSSAPLSNGQGSKVQHSNLPDAEESASMASVSNDENGVVDSGRLYYCTAAGGFEEVTVPLDSAARESAETLAEVVGHALSEPFLPAAPGRGACRWCDYNVVCGPYEEIRSGRKHPEALEPLIRLRGLS
jgi:ATP-dependent helicase/nuclease subunit B